MELEHKIEPIKCYASILPLVLEFIGFSCIRWSERLIPLFSEYIMHKDSTLATVKVCLIYYCNLLIAWTQFFHIIYFQAIEVFIKQTWPRKSTHCNVLLTILIKALYSEDKMCTQPKKENILAIIECIKTLEAARPDYVRNILNKLKACKELESKQIFKESLELL